MKKTVDNALLARVNTIVSRHAAKAAVARQGAPENAGRRAWYNFAAQEDDSEEADLYIFDEISSWWGVSANDFANDLAQIDAKAINLYLNSPGGSVFEGYAIYSALVRHSEKKNCKINVIIDGWAASIASVIAMAGDHIKIGAHAEVMVHQPWGYAIGTKDDMRNEADVLESLEETIIDIYEARTGGDRAEIVAWVQAETWFKGQKAVDAGFADELIPLKTKKKDGEEDSAKPAASADADYFSAIFPNMPDTVRAALTKQPKNKTGPDLPGTEREFKNFLREHGFSATRADAIAGNGFKPKEQPRDVAPLPEKPTTADPRDGAEKRDATVTALAIAAMARGLKTKANSLHRP